MTGIADLSHLPLEDMHAAAGAKFGGFAGWSMPITYRAGVLKEHQHTREKAGLFDISHMKLIMVHGEGAAEFLSHACPIDAAGQEIGKSKYTFLLAENAGILDDLIITRLADERFMVVANAGNAAADIAELNRRAHGHAASVEPLDRVFLALQGPMAASVAADAGLATAGFAFMTGAEPAPGLFMTRSGYTGEDGFEFGLPEDAARPLVEKFLADERVQWIGLAARDSLRLEAGLCLHGNDIDPTTTPVEAGLMWAVPKPVRETGAFVGAAALALRLAEGPRQRRVGLKPEGRQPVRDGAPLVDLSGTAIGRVTSGGFGPAVGHPVAMGYVATDAVKAGTPLFAEVRGQRLPVSIAPLPFFPHRYVKG